jgi:hypothetical protein
MERERERAIGREREEASGRQTAAVLPTRCAEVCSPHLAASGRDQEDRDRERCVCFSP